MLACGRLGRVTSRMNDQDLVAEIDANIGQNLRQARESRGISQAELARLVTAAGVQGVHQTTIARIESGHRSMRAAEGIAIAHVMETSLEWLAESGLNALLRSYSNDLIQNSRAFDAAAQALIWSALTPRLTSIEFCPTAKVGQLKWRTSSRWESIHNSMSRSENRIVSASPGERLENVLLHETASRQSRAYARPDGASSKQRVEFILEEYSTQLDETNQESPGSPNGSSAVSDTRNAEE